MKTILNKLFLSKDEKQDKVFVRLVLVAFASALSWSLGVRKDFFLITGIYITALGTIYIFLQLLIFFEGNNKLSLTQKIIFVLVTGGVFFISVPILGGSGEFDSKSRTVEIKATPSKTKATIPVTVYKSKTPAITPVVIQPDIQRIIEKSGCIPDNEVEKATLTRVIDGDTIEVEMDGSLFKVRLIGIDAPDKGSEYVEASSEYLKSLLKDNEIFMIKDVSETDRFDRLLRYVVTSFHFINYEMVANGQAKAVNYRPDSACHPVFEGVMKEAKISSLGMWEATVDPKAAPIIVQPPPNNQNCDPHYPTVCIPPYPPDLDCSDIPYRRFKVLPGDPHNFDGDFDGIGCESG